mmetsp:Transcript_54697/g.123068  ORF Transcript_54697/g.123068 Transcript_54697/m.123068 type:complete len:281 (+) Transcript_54697:1744-2586(+)
MRCSHGLLNMAVLEGKVETRLLVLHKLQGNLWEPLLLQVPDDRVAAELPIDDPHFHVIKLPVVEGQLEQVLCAVETLLVHIPLTIYVVHVLLVHTHNVNGALQGVDDAVVAVRQAVLHVAQSRVHKDAVLIPGAALHSDVLMEGVAVLHVLACHEHVVLGHACHVLAVLRPDHVADASRDHGLVDHLPACDIPHHNLILALQQNAVVAAREDEVCGDGRLKFLGKLVLQVVDADGPTVLQNRKPVPGREGNCLSVALLRRNVRVPGPVGTDKEVIAAVIL